ncbi:TetR/AcrR family transcriptional regulator [bacterium SCSIO 12696]|nr:TetR/AcrR family transcriptional regulator [bacterium SCSIO 12696]
MPRPSVKTERTEEILQAFERCVAQYGVEGSTLERLAVESGLKRSLIRHYVGNRDDLIKALLKRFLAESSRQTKELLDYLPEEGTAATLVEYLFDVQSSNNRYALVANALFSATVSNPYLAKPLQQSVNEFIDAIQDVLRALYFNSSKEDSYAVATGIVGIYFNMESLSALGDIDKWCAASKRSAHLLLKSLNS